MLFHGIPAQNSLQLRITFGSILLIRKTRHRIRCHATLRIIRFNCKVDYLAINHS